MVDICSQAEVDQQVGFIRSPNYPEKYTNQLSCSCELTAAPGEQIQLTVLDLETKDTDCTKDKLTIEFGGQQSSHCGTKRNKQTIASVNKFKLTFTTDESDTASGFWLRYEGILGVIGYNMKQNYVLLYCHTYTRNIVKYRCGLVKHVIH